MIRSWTRRILRLSFFLVALLGLLALPRWFLARVYSARIASPEAAMTDLPPIAVVFGAGLRRDGRPTAVLADRVKTAVELHQQGSVHTLIMSGSRGEGGYDEPAAMRALAIELGVPEAAIREDGGGTRTLETCRRAQQEFGLEQVTLVSQRYHLPRALAMCESLGLQAQGVAADRRAYRMSSYWTLREYPATLSWLWETLTARETIDEARALPMMEEEDGTPGRN